MTQAKERIFFAQIAPGGGTQTPCDHTAPKTNWRCVLAGATSGHLIDNLKRDRRISKPDWPAPGGGNRLADVSKSQRCWPHEAHHLIPWQQLKKHPVKQYLKAGRHLLSDANYSVNHGNNGKFMPFASDLSDWKGSTATKQKIAFELMDKVGVQLHQGRHSFDSYGGETTGYKTRVKELLENIRTTETRHRNVCAECKRKADNKKFPPRKQVTRKVDAVSSKLESEINRGKIFASRRAYAWWSNARSET